MERPSWIKIKEWETKTKTRLVRFKEKGRGDIPGILHEDHGNSKNDLQKTKFPISSEMLAESMWRAMGWTCDSKPNAVLKDDTETRMCMEEYDVVARHKSKEHEDTSQQSKGMEAQVELAQSRMCGTRLLRNGLGQKNGATETEDVSSRWTQGTL